MHLVQNITYFGSKWLNMWFKIFFSLVHDVCLFLQGLKSRVWNQIEVMSNSISTFVELVKEAVDEDKLDEEFKDMTEVGMQLVGQGTNRSSSSSEPTNSDDPFAWCSSQEEWWNDPKVVCCLDAAQDAMNKKLQLKKVDLGMPTFDLGIDVDLADNYDDTPNDGRDLADSSLPSASQTEVS